MTQLHNFLMAMNKLELFLNVADLFFILQLGLYNFIVSFIQGICILFMPSFLLIVTIYWVLLVFIMDMLGLFCISSGASF